MMELEGLRSELALLRISFHDAIMNGNSIDEIKKVYIQINDVQQSISKCIVQPGKTNASANGL
jgi:hypothetical protein